MVSLVAVPALVGLNAQRTPALSAEDHSAIQALYARYAYACDLIAGAEAVLADLFTPDGVLADETGRRYSGREQLNERIRASASGGASGVRHTFWNIKLDPAAGGATGRMYVVVSKPGPPGQPPEVLAVGQYWDDLARTGDGWRIRRREFHPVPQGAAAAPAPAATSRDYATPGRLSVDDYVQIHELYARYPYAFDGGGNQGRDYAQLFTPDGTFVNAASDQFIKGSLMLAAFASGALRRPPPFLSLDPAPVSPKSPLAVNHMLTDIMLTPTVEGIVGKAYWIRTTGLPSGVYVDLIVKTPEGWRFKEKFFIQANTPAPDGAKRLLALTPIDVRRSAAP
jgi:hypothetical protein